MSVTKGQYSKSGKTGHGTKSELILNDFLPDCDSKYFTEEQILGLRRNGVPYEMLSEGAKKVSDKMVKIHVERCKDEKAWREQYERGMAEPRGPYFNH